MPSQLARRQIAVARAWVEREGHPYKPDLSKPVDRIAGCRPCKVCDRFERSFLHPGVRRA